MSNNDNIILFDGICNLCNSLVRFIIKRDTKEKFKFAALQSSSGKNLLNKFSLDANKINTIVYIKGEKIYLKSTAILKILKDLGGIWKVLYVFILVPGFIRNFAYELVSKSRYKIFGRQESCNIPDSDDQHRFLA